MAIQSIQERAEQVRDVLRYLTKFNHATIVIHFDDTVIDSQVFSSHIRDIAFLHQAGLKIVIVPGSKKRIDDVLTASGISWTEENNIRIVDDAALPLVKMATFDVSNKVMTNLAQEQLTAVIGNWVRARRMSVRDGIDYGCVGEIDKINLAALRAVLDQQYIPIFPCIGWSIKGNPYNISSVSLACEIAVQLQAEKLFFVTKETAPLTSLLTVPSSIITTEDGIIPSLNFEEVELLMQSNKPSPQNHLYFSLLEKAVSACKNGVSRSHIINGMENGSLLCEIFSDNGSGTMVYESNYGGIRSMTQDDISSVLSLMEPFIEKGILLPRSRNLLLDSFSDYIVYEIDGGIKACAALHSYASNPRVAEIAGIAVAEKFSSLGIGPRLIHYLLNKARENGCSQVFLLTTHTSDWFEQFGFAPGSLNDIPAERKSLWTPERNSKVYTLTL